MIASIAVLGGGVAGWCAAAAFARRLPGVRVTVVVDPEAAPGLADVFDAATPAAVIFHQDIGLAEAELMTRTGALFRLGTRFEGWVEGLPPYVHAYGDHGRQIGSAAFHQHWLRDRRRAGPFGAYSLAVSLAEAGRFRHPDPDGPPPLSSFAYGYALDPARYAACLRDVAMAAGAVVVRGRVAGAERAGDRVTALHVAGAPPVVADLFVDTSGALSDTAGAEWINWSRWLPCDEAVVTMSPPAREPPLHDRADAVADGWRLTAARPGGTVHAHIRRRGPGAMDAPDGARRLGFRQGRLAAPWRGNVVAAGDAAVCLEPLESTNLHGVHAHVDRIIAALPGPDMNALELADYNRQTADEADRLRDFLLLHYATARRPEPFWRDVAEAALPDSVAGDLALFRERGRLRVHDGDSFDRDSHLAVLIGQGVIPRRHDALAETVPLERLPPVLDRLRAEVAAAAARAPRHAACLGEARV